MSYTPPPSGQVALVLSAPLPEGGALVLGASQGPQPYSPPAFDQVALNLVDPLPVSADLVLGSAEGGIPTPETFLGEMSGSFGLHASFQADTIIHAQLQASFGLQAAMSAGYDNAVFRGPQPSVHASFGPAATEAQAHTHAAWTPPKATPAAHRAPFGEAAAQVYVVGVGWVPVQPAPAHIAATHSNATSQPGWATSAFGLARPAGVRTEVPAQEATPTTTATGARHGHGASTPRQSTAPWGLKARATGAATHAGHHPAAKVSHDTRLAPWQAAKLVISTGGPWAPYQPPPPPPEPVVVDLRLCQQLAGLWPSAFAIHLVLGVDPCADLPPGATLYILPARFYMAVHQIEAHLLPSLAPLPIFDVSLSADSGSFAWSFSASAPPDAFDALTPTGGLPTSIRITLDGLQWVFVVDSLQRTEQFGKRGTRISGRSATALVGSPYSRETARLGATARNAQQLAAAALDLTDVALDWGIDDWLVPAGAWSHSGTPLAAVQALAEAAGGYVNSHRSAPTLLVRHPYPTLPGGVIGGPWNWAGVAVPDVELAPSAIITSSIDRRDGPDVDGIYVSGTAQGVLAHVKRVGTAGGKLASMVTDPLITANIAAQQRGLSVLGAAGAKHLVQISLPVLTGGSNPGVLDVGQLVQVNDSTPWRGMVRSVGVQAAQPKMRQTITLERHLT